MSLDLALLGKKIRLYREQFEASISDVAERTGLNHGDLAAFEAGRKEPTGDELLILADYFKCDYRFFVSNDAPGAFKQTDVLFRKHGDVLTGADRWAIQEFLHLCEIEQFLWQALGVKPEVFYFEKRGTFLKAHAEDAAEALRRHLGYQPNAIPDNVYDVFRRFGIHVFRRRLQASTISGLCVHHPEAGPCVLVNYSEDVFRQRFTAAHEAAHAFLDADQEVVVSYKNSRELTETRANVFASRFLLPPRTLAELPDPGRWGQSETKNFAVRLKVSTHALAIALKDAGLISDAKHHQLRRVRIPRSEKVDPELPPALAQGPRRRKEEMLMRGLSENYVELCFRAHEAGVISQGRLAEALLVDATTLPQVAALYRHRIVYGE
ncbi:MAG: helix-turn-helix domain-containing protein [Planctomycetota bacterium]